MRTLLVATMQSHICQFHRGNVEVLHQLGYQVDVAAYDNLAVKNGLKLDFADRVFNLPFARSPLSLKNVGALRDLMHIINQGNYDLIVCNTPVGGILSRLAARKARHKGIRVIYIAHGFHFYKGASMLNWMLYYPIEKLMSKQTDLIVTINDEDYKVAKNKFACKVSKIHSLGVSCERYFPLSAQEKRKEKEAMGYGAQKIILCTGELNRNKNQASIIKAMPTIVKAIPNARLLLAGNGPMDTELKSMAASLGIDAYVEFLGYRTDLETFAKIADVAVSCSHREGLPLNIVEAMLCKIPVVASDNRGHRELVHDQVNGYLVESNDSNAFADRVVKLLSDDEAMHRMGEKGAELAQLYTTPNVKEELKALYR